ncbi:HAMP domain-containing protein [Candidatus Villigracilis saccharophilus]|uniref:HAMP domain-containing protein n=1 Tax=Candidatus Villigracilis saccharophilus TaxID=3140684 RepID=UPI003136985B|nr:HAMP domain-containing protein [Anaerolineales bacterium]
MRKKIKVRKRRDEIGTIGKAFDELIGYMQGMGLAAAAIAENDLTTHVIPRSDKDELGNSFANDRPPARCGGAYQRERQ